MTADEKSNGDGRPARRTRIWSCMPFQGPGDPVWAVMAGDLVVALVKEERDAQAICRARGELTRMLVDSRRQSARIRALGEENKLLMATLRRVTDVLQRSFSPMEMINAKQEVSRVIKKAARGGRCA
jgi:hypothetical protein